MTNLYGDESSLVMPTTNFVPVPALPIPGLRTPTSLAVVMSGLTVPSKIVLTPLTTIWDDIEHIEQRVEMGLEYWKSK